MLSMTTCMYRYAQISNAKTQTRSVKMLRSRTNRTHLKRSVEHYGVGTSYPCMCETSTALTFFYTRHDYTYIMYNNHNNNNDNGNNNNNNSINHKSYTIKEQGTLNIFRLTVIVFNHIDKYNNNNNNNRITRAADTEPRKYTRNNNVVYA
jgi:hypothetical protein